MLNTYTVIMLGPSGSGKTVFLASMDKKLSIQGDLGFFLEIDSAEKRKRLKNLYTQIAIDERWPSATQVQDVSEWIFTCKVQTSNLGIYSACQFNYLDYAGGRLTDQMDIEDTSFDQTIKNADAVLVLLDGTRIISLMKNERLGNRWSINDLPNMLEIMQNTNKPLHFVISKWDIVQDYYTLEEVRDRLLEIDEFKNIVTTRGQSSSLVRLIPVSSVGTGFARLQPDGSMEKTGKMPQPFQVEMPLACILPDMIEQTLKELLIKKEQEQNQSIKVDPNLSWLDKLKKLAGGTVKAVASGVQGLLPKKYQFASDILEELIGFIEDEFNRPINEKIEIAERRTEELKRKKEESIKAVTDEESALKHAVTCFQNIVNQLETDFPSSKLKL